MESFLNRCFVLLSIVIASSCNSDKTSSELSGNWIGELSYQGKSLTVILNFERTMFGKVDCKVSIPDQAVYNYEADDCQIIDDSLLVKFSGSLDNTNINAKLVNGKISGIWVQDKHPTPLILTVTDETILFNSIVGNALRYAQQKSVYSSRVKWPQLESEVYDLANSAIDFEELAPALQHILDELRDRHGFVMVDGKPYKGKPQAYKPQDSRASRELIRASQDNNNGVISKMIDSNIGYLLLPTSPILDEIKIDEYIEEIQNEVCKLILNGAQNWIIDLRLNEGGNLAAMLTGLHELYGDQPIGFIVGADGKAKSRWLLKNSNTFIDKNQQTSIGKYCKKRGVLMTILILTSPGTSSAGEQVAVTLRGLPNARIIGEATSGHITNNSGFWLTQNISLYMSTGYFADRNGKIYRQRVYPDQEIIGGDNFGDLKKDAKVAAALELIKSNGLKAKP